MQPLPFSESLPSDAEAPTNLVSVQVTAFDLAVDQGAGEARLLGGLARRKVRRHGDLAGRIRSFLTPPRS